MKKCFLFGEGKCSGSISREHYISRSLLKFIAGDRDSIEVSGPPWLSEENQTIGIRSLQSKILCEGHNSSLSPLDAAALRFFETLNNVDKDPSSVASQVSHDGVAIERWFVKVLCGLTIAANWGDGNVYRNWKKLLLGKVWPMEWGLYFVVPDDDMEAKKTFFIQGYQRPASNKTVGVFAGFAGIPINLILHSPEKDFGTYHPDELQFQLPDGNRMVELEWPEKTGKALRYVKVGVRKHADDNTS